MKKYIHYGVAAVIAAPILYLFIVWDKLPQTVAMHFDLRGNPDRFADKSELWIFSLVFTVLNIAVYLLLTNIHKIDRKRQAKDNKTEMQKIAFAVVVFISAIFFYFIYSTVNKTMKDTVHFIFAGTGLLLSIVGNYMHSIKPNNSAGIRLPWTLKNNENWKKTHLLGGKLFFAGGILIAVICLFVSTLVAIVTLFTVTIIIAIITGVYSYRLYKKQKDSGIPQKQLSEDGNPGIANTD